jgi:hypothetical protein
MGRSSYHTKPGERAKARQQSEQWASEKTAMTMQRALWVPVLAINDRHDDLAPTPMHIQQISKGKKT